MDIDAAVSPVDNSLELADELAALHVDIGHADSSRPTPPRARTRLRFAPPPAEVSSTPLPTSGSPAAPSEPVSNSNPAPSVSLASQQLESVTSTPVIPAPPSSRGHILLSERITAAKGPRMDFLRALDKENPGMLNHVAIKMWEAHRGKAK
ncbi:hypothetical protein PENSPDRAFT_646178 [Peniophora sp. CONT]|nr:hypothetical protein PENSPDRAFT_659899 [Peniophora sp. CONT]KZV76726.1 hypothetical protein PENSPDRAFT_646178 [Peniophora sp. CONT]